MCDGKFTYCSRYQGRDRCDAPLSEKHSVAVQGDIVRQVDDDGFLAFKKSCEKTETEISCSERAQLGDKGTSFDESGTRSLVLNRVTGKLAWKYESIFGDSHKSYSKGIRGRLNTYDADCKVTENKKLF